MHAVVKGMVFNPLMYQQVPLEHHHLAAVSAVLRRLATEPWNSTFQTRCNWLPYILGQLLITQRLVYHQHLLLT